MSCACADDTLYTVWGDTRNGKMNIYFSKTVASSNTSIIISLLDGEVFPWSIFPNPSKEELYVSVAPELTGKQISVFDANGKQVLTTIVTGKQIIINTRKFEPGIYFLKIGNDVKRFIIE
jgi:hypothetical protein